MNLLEKVSQNGSTLANYVYLSDGSKVSATNASGDGLVYLGSFIYKKAGSSVSLESASFGGGKFVASATGLEPHYLMLDHLGSVRRVVNGIVLEHNDYYPFGMRWNGGQLSDNRYRYNGKEEQSFLNLPYSDYGARMYDSRRGGWLTSDPLLANHPEHGPYVFCAANPIKYVDYDGMQWAFYSIDGEAAPTWNWVDGDYYYTGVKDSNGNEVVLPAYDAVVVFDGTLDEKLGEDGTLTGEGANPAQVTVYGVSGRDDIGIYNGLTVSSNPDIYPMVEAGDYLAYHEQMETSIYGKDALTYRVKTMNGSLLIPPVGGINKRTGARYITGEYFHRTDWSGRATKSSQACLVIDGRSWRKVETQIGKSKNILIRVNR